MKRPDEIIGKSILEFADANYIETTKKRMELIKKGNTIGPTDDIINLPDGRRFDAEVMAAPVIFQGKQGVQVIVRDVSRRKKVERELQQRLFLSDALNNINISISSTFDFSEIMRRALEESTEVIGVEMSGIALFENERWVVRYIIGYTEEIRGIGIPEKEALLAAEAIEARKPVIINDAYNDARVNSALMERYGVRSLLTVPLLVRGGVLGAVNYAYASSPKGFTAAQIDFATKLGVSLSLALENAKLYDELENKGRPGHNH